MMASHWHTIEPVRVASFWCAPRCAFGFKGGMPGTEYAPIRTEVFNQLLLLPRIVVTRNVPSRRAPPHLCS
jgi:hypothetical protein